MQIHTLVLTRSGQCLVFKSEGRPISFFELVRKCKQQGIDATDRNAVPFIKDVFPEEIAEEVKA